MTLDMTLTTFSDLRAVAHKLFSSARIDAGWEQFKAVFSGKKHLRALDERLGGRAPRAQHSLGLRSVELSRITGSISRARDFDPCFHPLSDRMRERWVRIAELCLRAQSLPAVDLIQLGGEYFVRDGHHRVSVARALGLTFIDAQVTVVEI